MGRLLEAPGGLEAPEGPLEGLGGPKPPGGVWRPCQGPLHAGPLLLEVWWRFLECREALEAPRPLEAPGRPLETPGNAWRPP